MSNLYGLIGEKLGHSLSPFIHDEIFKRLGIEGSYQLFEVQRDKLKDAVLGLKALNARGVNVTIPYKIDIMEFLDNISEEALKIGSVNTLKFKNGKVTGFNTDYYGFGMMLKKHRVNIKDKRAIILGTGGAALAVSQYLTDNGIGEIKIISRNILNAGLKESIKGYDILQYKDICKLNNYDILINCTPCGMFPNADISPVGKNIVSRFKTVVDIIYNPRETLLLRYARECNIKHINGMDMLIGQGICAQEIWNDVKIDDAIITEIHKIMDNYVIQC